MMGHPRVWPWYCHGPGRRSVVARRWCWWPTRQIFVQVKVSTELWHDTKPSGERGVHLFKLGWYERDDCPTVRLYSLILLWLSIQIGF